MIDNSLKPLTRTFRIINKRGLHARASYRFVQTVEQFDARVQVCKDDMRVGGDEIMELLLLAASPGCTIDICAQGRQAQEVLEALDTLIADKFGENE